MILGKSQEVRTLTVYLLCNYKHGFKRRSKLIFSAYFERVSKSCDDKSCNESASALC